MNATVDPHDFSPYRWYDRLHSRGRCRHCVMSKAAHPIPLWVDARGLCDGRYYTQLQELATGLRGIKAWERFRSVTRRNQ